MNATMRIIPKTGLIRDPKTGARLEAGVPQTVPKVSYWLRRVKEGDVELEKAAAPKKKKAAKKAEESLEGAN